MNDPIGTFETIRDNFIRYVRTAFHIRNKQIDEERTRLLMAPDLPNNHSPALYRTPWVEPIPRYKSMQMTFRYLSLQDVQNESQARGLQLPVWFDQAAFDRFKGLVGNGLFDDIDRPLYKHQFEMLVRSLCGESLVITSGTGSGKTESFLLPIFARLASETLRQEWMNNIQINPRRDGWWKDTPDAEQWRVSCKNGNAFAKSYRVSQREGENEGRASVRAMIIYPMNALVEDQMSRLRKALDSKAARSWHAENLGTGQRIYFGRYNSETPVSGHEYKPKGVPNVQKITQLRNRLREAEAAFDKAVNYDQQRGGTENARFFFPSVDSAEMRSRWDMENSPPDIMVTNFSMLSVMLMREADEGIFEETKRWLAEDPKREENEPERIFHLVIDELHLYRGTAGTEIAYLIRLLLHRLGLEAGSNQLRVLASSASLSPTDQSSTQFLQEFFGKPGIGIIPGEVDVPQTSPRALDPQPFITLARSWITQSTAGLDGIVLDQALALEFEGVADALGGCAILGQGVDKLIATLTDADLAPQISDQFLNALLENPDRARFRAHDLLEFGRRVFGDSSGAISRENMMVAIRGLLIARGSAHRNGRMDQLPMLRFHWFFRNLEGLWASPDPADIDQTVGASAGQIAGQNLEDEDEILHQGEEDAVRKVGKLFANPRTLVTEAGNRVLELLYCEQCGEVMLGGIRLGDEANDFSLMANDPELEKVPDNDRPLLAKDRMYSDYGIFCPEEKISGHCPKWTNAHGNEDARINTVRNIWGLDAVVYEAPQDGFSVPGTPLAGWVKSHLFPKTGRVCQIGVTNGKGAITGYVYRVGYFDRTIHSLDSNYPYRAFPAVCPCCAEDYRYKSIAWNLNKKKSPIRTFRTGFTKISQIFAKELFKEIPEGSEGRKLIVFSDSREDAAKISNDIERFHYGDMIREIIYGDLHTYLLGGAEYLDHLQNNTPLSARASSYSTLFNRDAGKLEGAVDSIRNLSPRLAQLTLDEQTQFLLASQNCTKKQTIANTRTISLQELYAGTEAIVIKRLKNLGINPAGYSKEYQEYKQGRQFAEWHNMVDVINPDALYVAKVVNGVTFNENTLMQGGFLAIIKQRILEQMFGKLFYGIESSGLGYVAVHAADLTIQHAAAVCGLPPDALKEACRTVVRLLGEKVNYEQKDPIYGGPVAVTDQFGNGRFSRTGKFHMIFKYAEKICHKYNVQLLQFQQALSDVINRGQNAGWILYADSLELKLSSPQDPYWECNSCKKIHLHPSAGVCSHCYSDLNANSTGQCQDIFNKNYYASMISGGTGPFRLHTEELTGQTDDQPSRQRNFRNIVLDVDGPERVRTIDLLSVTTTMEVGIDIGGLSVVMQANMPPERFNYQQRAGRGGRRGQPYSAVMTLCRQRSHDTIHFEDPLHITGDLAPTPFLAMYQEGIARRVMAKGVLREAFRRIGVRWHNGPTNPPDTHGEFGCRSNWVNICGPLGQELACPEMQIIIQGLANALASGLQGQNVNPQGLVAFVNNELIGVIELVMKNPELYSIDGVAHALSEGGVLPLLGMPSRVRELFHGPVKRRLDDNNQCHYELPSIDRDLELAVSDFAPGSQRTKDKRIHQSHGICPPLKVLGGNLRPAASNKYFTEELWMARCNRCRYAQHYGEVKPDPTPDECPVCHASATQGFDLLRLIVPAAFYTEWLSDGTDSTEGDESVATSAARISDINSNAATDEQGLNVKRICEKGRLYTLNDNDGELFSGNDEDDNALRGTNFPNDGNVSRWASDPDGSSSFALAAPKVTDALVFRIDKVPRGIEVSPIRPVPQASGTNQAMTRPGVKSALISAAFLIRSAAADRLDIDPEEFDLCHLRLAEVDVDTTGKKKYSGEFILADHLLNGSGFTRRLHHEFGDVLRSIIQAADSQNTESIIDKIFYHEHTVKCQTSCYSCLQNFRNMRYHPLLDWRLGISMVRMLVNKNFVAGLDRNWNVTELKDWQVQTQVNIDNFIQNFGVLSGLTPFAPSAIKWGDRIIVIRHPLWDTFDPQNIFAEWITEAVLEVGEKNVRSVDSFDLFRRPAWVYKKLVTDDPIFQL